MHRIDGVLLALKPVARHVGEHDFAKAVLPGERLPDRQLRRRQRPEIGEQQAGAFLDRIGLDLAAGLRRLRTGGVLVGLFEAAAGLVHQPAVIAAADAGLLDPAIGHVGAAMRAMAVDQAVAAAAVAVEDEVLAHEADGLDRMAVELAGAADRLPVAAQQFAHRRAGADLGEHFVAGGGKQAVLADGLMGGMGRRLFHHLRRGREGLAVICRAASCSRQARSPPSEFRFKSKTIF